MPPDRYGLVSHARLLPGAARVGPRGDGARAAAGRVLSVEYVSKEPGGFNTAGDGGGSVERARSRSPYAGRRRSRSPSYGAARSRSPVRSPRCARASRMRAPARCAASAGCACAAQRTRLQGRRPLLCARAVRGYSLCGGCDVAGWACCAWSG